ncbi:hypothetical protein [Nitrobacter sp.]|uniref:hypothetical protein n=1 Tax=Nitrobacter sp. TaxID=29420 RepID=UPI0029CAB838|nr:hypothetical protein [Nitrobacter sp.]
MARRKTKADSSAFSEGAKVEGLDQVSKLASSAAAGKSKGIGHNSGGITDDELKRQIDHGISLYADVLAAKKVYDKAQSAWRSGIDIAVAAGAPKAEFQQYIKDKAKRAEDGDGATVAHHRNMNRILRVMGDPLGTQWNLFAVAGEEVDDKTGKPANSAMDAELQGQAAYRNNEPETNNPFQPGTEDYVAWDNGWRNAMKHTVMAMGPKTAPEANGAAETH